MAVYPLFGFLAVRFAISTAVLAPFAWGALRSHPARRRRSPGSGAGVLLAAAYGLQTAGLELTTVSSTGFITGLYVVLTPLLALALFRTPVPAAAWARGRALPRRAAPAGGIPGGSALGNALVLGNAVAAVVQIIAMERFAPRYDARALTFLQMALSLRRLHRCGSRPRRPRAGPGTGDVWYALVVHRRLRGRVRLPRRDLGAVADDRGQSGPRVHPRGAVRGALRRAAALRAARRGRLGRVRRDARGDPARRAGRGLDPPSTRAGREPRPDGRGAARALLGLPVRCDDRGPARADRAWRRPARRVRSSPCCPHSPSLSSRQRSAGTAELAGLWPFLLAGVLGPGISQVLFTFAVRDAGPSRTSAAVGTAPLFAVFFAVVLLDEPLVAGVASSVRS